VLEKVFTSTKQVPAINPLQTAYLRFMKAWRAFYYSFYGDTGSLYKLFHDGTCIEMSDGERNTPMATVGGGVCFYIGKTYSGFPRAYKVYPADEFMAVHIIADGVSVSSFTSNTGSMIDLENGKYYVPGTNIVTIKQLSNGATLQNLSISGMTGNHTLHWVRNGEAVGLNYSTGNTIFFNYATGEKLLTTKIDPFFRSLGAYDCVNHVIVTVGSDRYVRVYVPVAVPHHFSGPTLNPSSPEQWGHSHVTARLLGDQNEPCADYWVHWRLLNGKGWLEDYVSKTDEDGYAYNYYFSPTLESQLGSEEIFVEVVV